MTEDTRGPAGHRSSGQSATFNDQSLPAQWFPMPQPVSPMLTAGRSNTFADSSVHSAFLAEQSIFKRQPFKLNDLKLAFQLTNQLVNQLLANHRLSIGISMLSFFFAALESIRPELSIENCDLQSSRMIRRSNRFGARVSAPLNEFCRIQ